MAPELTSTEWQVARRLQIDDWDLDETQRAFIAAKLAIMQKGGDRDSNRPIGRFEISQPEAAKICSIIEQPERQTRQPAR
jgi:hypothetical protein